MLLRFGDFTPDQMSDLGGDITGVIPMDEHYEPFAGPTDYGSGTLSSRPQGAFSCRSAAGTPYNFFGDSTRLYLLNGLTFDDVSSTFGGSYTTGADERWNFVQFGERVIATNFTDPMQGYLMGTSTKFANLSGSPPRARYITAIKDFVVVANCDTGVTRVQWSAQGDPTASWATSPATQADYQDLDTTRGWIRAIVGGEYGVIFQENAITRMTYVGSPLVFQFDEVESGRGTNIPGSVIKVGNIIYYIGTDYRFYAFDGNRSVGIGAGRVDNLFESFLNRDYLDRVKAIADPDKPIIYWFYPSVSDGNLSAVIAYNYQRDRFTSIALADADNYPFGTGYVNEPFIFITPGYTLEGLTAVNSSVDALVYSLDSPIWTGGERRLAGFDKGPNFYQMQVMEGPPVSATLWTPEFEPNPGGKATMYQFRPVVEYKSATLPTIRGGITYRNELTDVPTTLTAQTLTTSGFINMRKTGRYFRCYLRITSATAGVTYKVSGVRITRAAECGVR